MLTHKRGTSRITILVISLVASIAFTSCLSLTNGPNARYGAVMVYDAVENRAILFGGRAEGLLGLKYFNDIWTFDAASFTWDKADSTNPPPARLSPGMVYDPDNHQLILFGGYGEQDRLGDTWLYNLFENKWEEVSPVHGPPPRSDTAMAYDQENQVVIMFGGYCQEDSRELCDDTWSFDPRTRTWTELNPPSSPPITYGHTMVYDNANRELLLWGGHMSTFTNGQMRSAGYGDSTWSYDFPKNEWRETVQISQPRARYWHKSDFFTDRGIMVIFGGDSGEGYLDDTWLLDVTNNSWQRVNVQHAPPPRINPMMTYDSSNQVVILFGGLLEDMTDMGDTWILSESGTSGDWREVEP